MALEKELKGDFMNFKELLQNFIIMTICLGLLACTKASFTVQPLSVQNVHLSGDNSDLTKSRTLLFTVSACMNAGAVKSEAQNQHLPVVDEPFEISGGAEPLVLMSDAKGCVYWPESITFQYLNKESFISLSRKITAKGNLGGSETLDFAIDPWKNSADVLWI